MTQVDKREYSILAALLILVGILLVVSTIRGPFIIDEINYLVTATGLREGKLTVPGTEGLSPSKELFSFDPEAFGRVAVKTPVASLAPPLYAPFALPFLIFGWRGLVLLNTLSFLFTILLVFTLSKRYAVDRQTPWIAAALVLLGGYSIEYAQGVWPHMFSVFLVTAAVFLASKVWEGRGPVLALSAGVLIGIATGVREQNIVLVAFLGITVLWYAQKKMLSAIGFGIGTLIPLLTIAVMNFSRDHLWHPFPKVVAYSTQVMQGSGAAKTFEPLKVFWARFVDFSSHPAITYPHQSEIYRQNPESGAFLVLGTLKKAFLQSSPWLGLAFVVLLLVWFSKNARTAEIRRNQLGLSLLIFPMVLMFSLAGGNRADGLAYNQRYFLEMVPLAAVALVLALDGLSLNVPWIIGGALAAGVAYAGAMMLPSHTLYELALLRIPLLLAVLLILCWIVRARVGMRSVLAIALGLCLGWSFFVHVLDDLPASRTRRSRSAVQLEALEATIPNHSALFAYWGSKDVAGALHLSRDVVILDAGADEGADAGRLTRELQGQNRRLFVLRDYFPIPILRDIIGPDSLADVRTEPLQISEILKRNR